MGQEGGSTVGNTDICGFWPLNYFGVNVRAGKKAAEAPTQD
jgi:hypothetical protein